MRRSESACSAAGRVVSLPDLHESNSKTFGEVAAAWFESRTRLRPRTRERYEIALRIHLLPRLGDKPIASITEDDIARLIASMQKGLLVGEDGIERPRVRKVRKRGELVDVPAGPYAGWTIKGSITPLSLIMKYAVRRGLCAANPVEKLEKDERPEVSRQEMRTLDRDEIGKLLKATDARYGPLLMTAIHTGLRLGELLGLTWAEVDFDAGFVRVRKQLGRDGTLVEPKTPQAVREVVMTKQLADTLRDHKLRSSFSEPSDFVFASRTGSAWQGRNVARRGLDAALQRAGLKHMRFHDLRHTAASLMIASYPDVVFVSLQLGHANPSITLSIYAHLFDKATHAEEMRSRLEVSHGTTLETAAGDWWRTEGAEQLALDAENVAVLPVRRTAANGG